MSGRRYKTVQVSEEVWEKLQELKIKHRKRSLSEVIEELLRAYERCQPSTK